MNYALLGNITFNLLNAPTALNEQKSATFAQHNVLSGKPKLQAMGLGLSEITLDLSLHHKLGDVESHYQSLLNAKQNQQALALVLGFSNFKGHFVITDISSQAIFTDQQGNALARNISLTLKEFIGNTQQELQGLALQLGNNYPLSSFLKASIKTINQTTTLIKGAIKVYRQTKQIIANIRNLTTTIQSLIHDPLTALTHLPNILASLDTSIASLTNTLGLQHSFTLLTDGIKGTQYFMQDLAELNESLIIMKNQFNLGTNAKNLGDWFNLGVKEIDNTEDILERMDKPVAQMSAWIMLRSDTINQEENHD